MHPRSKHWHLLDYVITRQSDQKDVLDTRVRRGADRLTRHNMIRSKLAFVLRKTINKTQGKLTSKINVAKLRNEKVCRAFQKQMDKIMEDKNDENLDLEE